MENPQTCGQGVAASADLPATISEIVASMAETLEVHMDALDAADPNSRREREAYAELAAQQRDIASALSRVAVRMEECRDLPMGPHNMEVMASETAVKAFEGFVRGEGNLAALLQSRLDQDRLMLAEMGGSYQL